MRPLAAWTREGNLVYVRRSVKDLPDPVDLPAGYRFGNYIILDRIGRGGMAGVYRAEHSALSKQVAIKIMDHALHDKSAAHRQFLREGRAAAAVKHPNVVDITDVGVWQGVPFLVMEFLDGCDLETQLREHGPLSDGELVRLALPIIAGLAVAHDAGVIHRDLKPSNIFLARGADGDQVPKVLDFGISKVLNDVQDLSATPYGTVMGTPLYLPPEALAGAHHFSPASDQYSLGVVLYECAVGRPPHRQDTLVALLQSIGSGKFDPPSRLRPDISALVERAILRAMHPDPRQRFAHVRDLGRALWEVASPRTQLLWGRTFGDDAAAASSVRGGGISLSSLSLGQGALGQGAGHAAPSARASAEAAPAHSSTRKLFATELTVPLSTRGKLLWGAGAAVGVVCAGALTLLMRRAAVPLEEPHMSTLEQPQLELNAALRPPALTQPALTQPGIAQPALTQPGIAQPGGLPSVAPLAAAPQAVAPRSAPVAHAPALADTAAERAVREPQVAIETSSPAAADESREVRRRKRTSSAPSTRAPSVERDVAVPRAPEPRTAPARDDVPALDVPPPARPAPAAPVGANQSPILD